MQGDVGKEQSMQVKDTHVLHESAADVGNSRGAGEGRGGEVRDALDGWAKLTHLHFLKQILDEDDGGLDINKGRIVTIHL